MRKSGWEFNLRNHKIKNMNLLFIIILLIITNMSFSQSDTSQFILKIKLIFADPPTPPCGDGNIVWAVTHKAVILENNTDKLKPKDTLLLIQPCLELFKIGYLSDDKSYKVKISKTNDGRFNYTVVSQFLKENYPKYWIREIETIKK